MSGKAHFDLLFNKYTYIFDCSRVIMVSVKWLTIYDAPHIILKLSHFANLKNPIYTGTVDLSINICNKQLLCLASNATCIKAFVLAANFLISNGNSFSRS